MIWDCSGKMIFPQERAVFCFILMDGIAKKLHFSGLQQGFTVRAVLRCAGHDQTAARIKKCVRQFTGFLTFQLRIRQKAHAALRYKRQRLHLRPRKTVACVRAKPETVGLRPGKLV